MLRSIVGAEESIRARRGGERQGFKGEGSEGSLQIRAERVGDVKGEGLKASLLRCLGVVSPAKTDTGADFGPVEGGMVGNVKGRGGCNSVGNAGRGLSKVDRQQQVWAGVW